MKKLWMLLGLLLFASLVFGQGGATTIIRNNPTTLPTACGVGDVFMKAGAFYINTGTSPGACTWSAGKNPTFTGTITAAGFISNGTGPWTTLTERANAITPAAGSDICDQDATAHGILCSFNNQVAQGVVTGGTCQASQSCAAPLAKPLHIWAGSFTFSSTSQAVTGLGTLCPTAILSVWASSQSHAYAYQISSISTAGFTITTTSNTDVWNWGVACF